MKITRFSSDGLTQKSVELSELIESMKTEGKGSPVSNLRNEIKLSVRRERCDSADKLPVIVFSSTFCRQKGRYQFSKYNGHDHLRSPAAKEQNPGKHTSRGNVYRMVEK